MAPGGSSITTVARPPSKRARTRTKATKAGGIDKASLTGLRELPVEILTEIFKNTCPADLISLARTSKSFRIILMKRSAEDIWRCAEGNVPGLPSYPWSDINRPQYAALMFTKNCTGCGKYTASNVDPFLLVRLCQDCRGSVLAPMGDWRSRRSEINDLVLKTNRIKCGHPDRNSEYDRHVYGLATEVKQVKAMIRAFSQAPLGDEFKQWKQDVRKEVGLRQQFGTQVSKYLEDVSEKHSQELEVIKKQRMTEIETKLRVLGWTDEELDFRISPECGKWLVLVKRIRPITEETWSTLLPKLTPLLEANRDRIRKLDSTERRETYKNNVHQYLEIVRLVYHPLEPFIETLGFGHLLDSDATPNGRASTLVFNFLNRYPFPDTPTALGWSFIKKLRNEDMDQMETFDRLADEENRIDAEVMEFIEEIEEGFVCRLIPESAIGAIKYRAKRSTPPTGTDELSRNTQILLRADALFANEDTHNDDPEQPQKFYYYTDCLPPRGDHNDKTNLFRIAPRYCRYEKAEEVAGALLECIGMPNASYLELAILGKKFFCGRCSSLELMDWKGILKHYLDELHIWSALSTFKSHPKFRPQSPIYMTNLHKLDDLLDREGGCLPLVSLLNNEQVDFQKFLMAMDEDLDNWYCAPCRNYGRSYVSRAPESSHMWRCHRVREHDVMQGVHYFLVKDATSFLERGGAWVGSWDAHHNGREADPEVDDEDVWN